MAHTRPSIDTTHSVLDTAGSETRLLMSPRRLIGVPAQLSSFIGRTRELTENKPVLMNTRLLTLTGPGGCGKTRLAQRLAQELLVSFPDGAWFVDLAPLTDHRLVPQSVVSVVGLQQQVDRPLDQVLIGYFQMRNALLIFDNCEHLLDAAADLVTALLHNCPKLRVLTTSREPLNLSEEIVWLVPPLAMPEAQPPASFDQIAQAEAIQLFVARASVVLPGFTLTAENAVTVEHICRRLDGIPLAIELAAARVKLLDVAQIDDRLDDSMRLLTRGSRTAAPRHQTMRAALDWSYSLLPPRERLLFQRLAVFAGGYTLEAAEAVCHDPDVLKVPILLDVLANLVDKSLVITTDRTPGEAVYYRLLEPIRQYALDRLRETGDEAATRDRHLEYFLSFAEQAEPQLKSDGQLQWLRRLEREQGNLRAALAWCGRNASRAVAGLRLAKALHLFWQRRGYWSEGRRELEQAVANYDAHSSSHSGRDNLYLARAVVALSWLAVYLQDYSHTRQSLERGLALAQESGDDVTMAHALGLLSFLDTYAGNHTAAAQFAAASVASARQAGDPWSTAWSLHVFGRNRYGIGDEQAGRAALEESEALLRATGDRRMLAVHINTMAIIAENAGELQLAHSLFEETLKIGQALEDNELQSKALANLAGLAMIQGDIQRAEPIYKQLLNRNRSLGTQLMAISCFIGLARIRILQGDFETAEQLLRECLARTHGRDHQVSRAISLAGMSRIYVERGQAIQAARIWGTIDRALKRRLDADDRVGLDQWEAAARAALTPREFEAAFAAGQALTLEQVSQEVMSFAWEGQRDIQLHKPVINTLRLSALGPARALWDKKDVITWPYARVKELLFYLVSHSARTKAQIGLALWPDASPAQLRNSLSTTLYQLRRVLGHPAWIIFEHDQYRFNRKRACWFDVDVFEDQLRQAARLQVSAPERAIVVLQAALALYHGDFVEDLLNGEWFLLRREELRRKYLDGLLLLGQLTFAQNEYARAAEAYRQAIEKDEVLEEAHRELMRCYARLGERGRALRHYQTFEQMIRDELGSAPAAESAALYARLQRGDEV